MPGADYQLTRLLSLCPYVKRYMMYQQGCFAGAVALRLAKDLAENNKGARVLVVCLGYLIFVDLVILILIVLWDGHCLEMVWQL